MIWALFDNFSQLPPKVIDATKSLDASLSQVGRKESACGCAGIFNAPFAIESYAATFDEDGALDKLEAFASEHGPRFYGLPLNTDSIVLERIGVAVPQRVKMLPEGEVVPFHAGETLPWRLASVASAA